MATSQEHHPPPVPQHDRFYNGHHQQHQQQQQNQHPSQWSETQYTSPHQQQFPSFQSNHYQEEQQPFPRAPQQPQHQRPNQQHPNEGRQRTKSGSSRARTFSFRSDKSHNSADLHETHAEKEAKRLHSKADPTLAMNEAEPTVVAATVKSSLAPLRNMQHKDYQGNVIDDPDRSNPTRSRWERPLDTIRSFEAAIDGNYSSRQSVMTRADSDSVANWNRRNSYFSVNNHSSNQVNRYQSRDSYYSVRPHQSEYGYGPDYEMPSSRGYNAYSHGPRQRASRMTSDFQYSTPRHAEQVYPMPMNHRSYETVASGSGSGISGEPGYTTDPTSSDNSSVERVQSTTKNVQKPPNDYGIGFSQGSSYTTPAFSVGMQSQNTQYQNGAQPSRHDVAPAVPQKPNTIARKPTQQSVASAAPERPGMGEKRKSWFSRRFSKNG